MKSPTSAAATTSKTSIKWSKSERLPRPCAAAFDVDERIDESVIDDADVDCTTWTKRPSTSGAAVHDRKSKAARLKSEGAAAAEGEQFDRAVELFGESLTFVDSDAGVWDMRAQAYMCLGQDYAAIQSAMHAVRIARTDVDYRLTLARAHRNFGEIQLALRHVTYARLTAPWSATPSDEQRDMLATKTTYDAKVAAMAAALDLDNRDV